ncbi:MAG: monooxygenase [Burkholderiales bacterium]
MIITLTSFKLATPVTHDEARAIFLTTAPKYRDVKGLLRKHYVVADDGTTVGGVYVWRARADAQAMYTDAWREFVRGKYGTEPVVTYFDSPVLVDNVAGQITSDA